LKKYFKKRGVINFTTSTITNKYDGMNGVNYKKLKSTQKSTFLMEKRFISYK